MKSVSAAKHHILRAALMLAAMLTIGCSAKASPPPGAYSLVLAQEDRQGYRENLSVTLTVINTTQNTLVFRWAPYVDPALKFTVEYAPPVLDPDAASHWQPLSLSTQAAEPQEKIVISPNRVARLSVPLRFPAAALGNYRITVAAITLPAEEYGPAHSSKPTRQITLILHAEPFLFRQISGQYATHRAALQLPYLYGNEEKPLWHSKFWKEHGKKSPPTPMSLLASD